LEILEFRVSQRRFPVKHSAEAKSSAKSPLGGANDLGSIAVEPQARPGNRGNKLVETFDLVVHTGGAVTSQRIVSLLE
jgi:hypothetical protein